MKRKDSVTFFLRFLLLTVVTVILLTLSFGLTGTGNIGLVIAGLIVVFNILALLSSLVIAFYLLVKHIFDRNKDYFDFMYVINFLFTILVNGVFLAFYFVIMAASMLFLLPFL